jgi:hypothetical protein
MALFGQNPDPGKDDLPIMQVRQMRSQGLDNNQIIQALQRDGYKSSQIFGALNQADMPGGGDMTSPQQPGPMSPEPQPVGQPEPFQQPVTSAPYYSHESNVTTEELVEAIIEEKWNDLVADINKIIEWKNNAQNTITSMEQQFKDLKMEFDKLHQAVIAKVGEYDQHILNVGSELKAMEKVFSKVLPVFTDNVAELSKITKNVRKK